KKRKPASSSSSPSITPTTAVPETRKDRLRALLGDVVAGVLFGPFFKLMAAFVLGFGGLMLTLAWQSGPMQLVEKTKYAKLAAHPPRSTFLLSKPYPKTALEELQRSLDEPVEHAIAGWATPTSQIALALNPQQPDEALPATYVDQRMRQGSNWLAFVIAAGM